LAKSFDAKLLTELRGLLEDIEELKRRNKEDDFDKLEQNSQRLEQLAKDGLEAEQNNKKKEED